MTAKETGVTLTIGRLVNLLAVIIARDAATAASSSSFTGPIALLVDRGVRSRGVCGTLALVLGMMNRGPAYVWRAVVVAAGLIVEVSEARSIRRRCRGRFVHQLGELQRGKGFHQEESRTINAHATNKVGGQEAFDYRQNGIQEGEMIGEGV